MNTFSFDVDEAYAKKNNEFLRDTKRLQTSAFFFGVVLLALGGFLYYLADGAVWGWMVMIMMGIMAIISFIMIPVLPRQVGSASSLYQQYPLIPAVVAEINPRDVVLLALVNINADPSMQPRWGLAVLSLIHI